MKKLLILLLVFCVGVPVFAQGIDLGLGFQYGTARIFDSGETIREITEPGLVLTFRLVPETIGFFARVGLLFPSNVTEYDVTLSTNDFDYILFLNAALGVSFKTPINNQFTFVMDAGISINNLFYRSSFRDDIDTSWVVRIEQMGVTYSGGHRFGNVLMKENYNDIALGIIGNPAIRFNFTPNVFIELGAAASFDFLRFRTWRFSADFNNAQILNAEGIPSGPATSTHVSTSFPDHLVDDGGMSVTFETDSKFSVFKQFTFIPSISVGFSF